MLGALVLCSPSEHVFRCTLLTPRRACVNECNALREASEEPWFQIGKGVRQGCILSLCLFNLYAEYIMRNVALYEAQAGIKMAGKNNNLRYADDTTLMAESAIQESLDESERGK